MPHDFFSIPQLFGYCAFVFGVACFLQKSDLRFKVLLVCESISYVLHFWLLGNFPAMASSSMAGARTLTSIWVSSRWVAAFFVTLTIALGCWLVTSWVGVLPIVGSCIGTLGVFQLTGITMRWTMFVATCLWLANNILSGSIGGTALEVCIALSNLYTIRRLYVARANAKNSA
ncbi:YgjV family protein [Uliginosibacterium sp. H3]|uniref:YgjV family protein n=1 Tax=Uliginosibacterium silvisoli TaxID=3114758 RepID=A0ABU6K317_9RHOO|nr:YgjV family protein [Uliginosibacterium sp. H3]